jgi:hypothetical protein
MPIQTSFPKVADQILAFNKNIVEVLTKINSLASSTESTVSIDIIDTNGVTRTFSIPTNNQLKSDIERLNNNINSLYSIDAAGALIQTTAQNKFKKIITVDLNREPIPVASLNSVSNFKSSPNWFFDSLLDPMLSIEFDLSNKIENNVRKCQVRRYIVDFAKNENGDLTNLGQSALNSFNTLFKGSATVVITDFENWHRTTPGIVEPLNPRYDEQVFDLEPNNLLYDGQFSVLRIQEDRINRKLWYVLDTLDYIITGTSEVRQLNLGDELIVNVGAVSSTRYKIIEVSTAESNPRVRVERVEGIEPIPTGIGTLKIYSPVIYTKKLRVSVGYDERNVLFLKPINTENNLVAKNWSLGTGYFTSELTLNSNSDANGLTMDQFYQDYVYDYGEALKDLVAKKTPNKLAGTPNAPTLNSQNFKVVQINQHLTDTPDSNLVKQKHNSQVTLKSEVEQIQSAITDRNKKLKIVKFKSESDKKKADLEIQDLINKKDSKSKLLASLTKEIIDLSSNPATKVDPKYRVRGFWSIPEPVSTRGTKPQEVVQFRVQYRYVSKDGRESPIESYEVDGQQSKASFSNWIEIKTDARKRTFDSTTGEYYWEIEDLESADTPNINQIDLSLQSNERLEFKIKSISEVGWPESPIESDWSEIMTVDFPDDLNNILNENDFILKEATKEDLKVSMNQELSAKGLDEHLGDQITVNGKVYHHETEKILSGFRDDNGVALDLLEYLKRLENRVRDLEERINRIKGELEIVVLRNNQEFVISNGSETVFNIECEDYLEPYSASGVPTGRVYQNNIYVIKDFVMVIRNKAQGSPLGLLSDKTYLQNSNVYNSQVPQSFWVNDKDELLTSDISGQTRTQINNQFTWQVNYDSVSESSVTKLSENIGNIFNTSNNSITSILGSNEFNIGYNETSILSFIGNNKSLLDPSKWVDSSISVASTTKLLTSIHPVVQDLEKIVETNSDKVKTVNPGSVNDIIIPINIYFKMNSLDTNQTGLNYDYINLNASKNTVKHIKKIKFLLENESENRPFTFSLKFNINRNKVIMKKIAPAINVSVK